MPRHDTGDFADNVVGCLFDVAGVLIFAAIIILLAALCGFVPAA